MSSDSLLEVFVDGIEFFDLHKYRVRFGPFELALPADNIWDLVPGVTKAVSDGFWIFLRPLKHGNHRISFCGVEPNFHTEVMYDNYRIQSYLNFVFLAQVLDSDELQRWIGPIFSYNILTS